MDIAWDLDGVKARTEHSVLAHFQARGRMLDKGPDDITHYMWEEAFPDEVHSGEMVELFRKPGFYARLEACPLLTEAARHVERQGHRNHVVTARPAVPHVKEETRAWLSRQGVRPYRVAHTEQKLEYVRRHGCGLLIEDKFETANRIAQHGVPALLVAAPYNTPSEYGRGPLHPMCFRLSREQIARFFQAFTPDTESYMDAALDAGLLDEISAGW